METYYSVVRSQPSIENKDGIYWKTVATVQREGNKLIDGYCNIRLSPCVFRRTYVLFS